MSQFEPILILAGLAGIAAAVMLKKDKTREVVEKFVGGVADTVARRVSSGGSTAKLWFVIDDYGTNSRRWVDFGARNSRDINIGFLNITRARCNITQGGDYDVVELLGREAVARKIREFGGVVPTTHEALPPYLWRAWARAALLNYAGGLYLDGLALCVGPSFKTGIGSLSDAVFGFEHDERRVNVNTAIAPTCSHFAGWASGPGHLGWRGLCGVLTDFAEAGPQSWTAAEARNQISAWNKKYLHAVMPTIRTAEWSRRPDGLPIEIEDLLGRTSNKLTPEWEPSDAVVYVPIDKDVLDRSVTYKWFLRMSPDQIMDPESQFLWASLAKRTGSKDSLFSL